MTYEQIISSIVSFFIYTGLFYAVLTWLGVKEKRITRGLFLAGVLILADFVAYFIYQAIESSFVSVTVIVVVFYLITRKLLVLKTWQYIVIPLGVYLVGQYILLFFIINFILPDYHKQV